MNTPMAVDTRAREWNQTRAEVEVPRGAKVPRGRKMGTGWDVAYAALYLASDEAKLVTSVKIALSV
jgi:NAD(P)-dependent dehydrogenase (short-subunit alcohol dehydrogenase family)